MASARPADPIGEDDAGRTAARAGALLDDYRRLIAHPRRSEISRWLEEQDGLSCEAREDDALQITPRGEGARLALVPLSDRFALLLPSALLVVDFATSFSDVLTARAALRHTFELEADGSGMLRLIEPALAAHVDGVWRVEQPGRLAGLATG